MAIAANLEEILGLANALRAATAPFRPSTKEGSRSTTGSTPDRPDITTTLSFPAPPDITAALISEGLSRSVANQVNAVFITKASLWRDELVRNVTRTTDQLAITIGTWDKDDHLVSSLLDWTVRMYERKLSEWQRSLVDLSRCWASESQEPEYNGEEAHGEEASRILEAAYRCRQRDLNLAERRLIAAKTGLTDHQIQVWFRNRRQRGKAPRVWSLQDYLVANGTRQRRVEQRSSATRGRPAKRAREDTVDVDPPRKAARTDRRLRASSVNEGPSAVEPQTDMSHSLHAVDARTRPIARLSWSASERASIGDRQRSVSQRDRAQFTGPYLDFWTRRNGSPILLGSSLSLSSLSDVGSAGNHVQLDEPEVHAAAHTNPPRRELPRIASTSSVTSIGSSESTLVGEEQSARDESRSPDTFDDLFSSAGDDAESVGLSDAASSEYGSNELPREAGPEDAFGLIEFAEHSNGIETHDWGMEYFAIPEPEADPLDAYAADPLRELDQFSRFPFDIVEPAAVVEFTQMSPITQELVGGTASLAHPPLGPSPVAACPETSLGQGVPDAERSVSTTGTSSIIGAVDDARLSPSTPSSAASGSSRSVASDSQASCSTTSDVLVTPAQTVDAQFLPRWLRPAT